MIVSFTISNFMSFDSAQTLSFEASKIRKHSDRVYTNRRLKLVKCKAIFGANASGKTNLVSAFRFVQQSIVQGFPIGYSNMYCRLNEENRLLPSVFDLEFIVNERRFHYRFSVILNTGSIIEEQLYEVTASGIHKDLYNRHVESASFSVEAFTSNKKTLYKLNSYLEDCANDQETLFLSLINKNKEKMYEDYPVLHVLKDVYIYLSETLNVSGPDEFITFYPLHNNDDFKEAIALLDYLNTGINDYEIVEIPLEVVKHRIPEDIYNNVTADLEKEYSKCIRENRSDFPSCGLRSMKELYKFSIDEQNKITVQTLEFNHKNADAKFGLYEESDGTARLMDILEILLNMSDNRIYIIDEINRCLHPSLTTKIVELFLEKAKKRNTQLIITTHEYRLLDERILRNDEILFTKRTDSGTTEFKSTKDYIIRSDRQIYEALFDGDIDVKPEFNSQGIDSIIHKS